MKFAKVFGLVALALCTWATTSSLVAQDAPVAPAPAKPVGCCGSQVGTPTGAGSAKAKSGEETTSKVSDVSPAERAAQPKSEAEKKAEKNGARRLAAAGIESAKVVADESGVRFDVKGVFLDVRPGYRYVWAIRVYGANDPDRVTVLAEKRFAENLLTPRANGEVTGAGLTGTYKPGLPPGKYVVTVALYELPKGVGVPHLDDTKVRPVASAANPVTLK